MKKRLLFTILTTGLLLSCSSSDKQENDKTVTSVDIKTFDTTIYFAGTWLSEDYFNSINKFKSPKLAQDGSSFISIPDRTLKKTMMIANFHEGGPSLTILKNQDKYQIWEMQDDSIVGLTGDIEVISDTKIKINDKNFIKINPFTSDDYFKILEEILFKGVYTDSNGKNIEFKNNGEIVGLDKFHYYRPLDDYFDSGSQVDQISLSTIEKEYNWFGFKFNNDTLEIYKLNCLQMDSVNNDCVIVENGELKYKLWRK